MVKSKLSSWEKVKRAVKGSDVSVDYGLDEAFMEFPLSERSEFEYPLADIIENDKDIIIRLDLPGLEKNEIQVNLTETEIEVRGEKKKEQLQQGERFVRSERYYSGFYRKFSFPETIVPQETNASYRNGVLYIKAPKSRDSNKTSVKIE